MDILRFITAGSVDDGKSTLIGRLLYDSKNILADQLQAIHRAGKRKTDNLPDLALLTDGLRAEREQGITIDVAYKYFSSPNRKFIIADAPGHVQYTRNMVTGASNADLIIILIDARQGVTEQTRRHSIIASLLQIPQVVVAINKLDLVNYSQECFDEIVSDFSQTATQLGLRQVTYIPISALYGDNVVDRSQNIVWYNGPSLLAHLESVPTNPELNDEYGRFFVQYVIRPQTPDFHDYRGYAGRVISGTFRVGDDVFVLPSNIRSRVSAIEYNHSRIKEAGKGDSIVLHLEDDIDVSRGDLIVPVNDIQPKLSQEQEALVCWMQDKPLREGDRYTLQLHSRTTTAIIKKIVQRIDVQTLQNTDANQAQLNEIVKVQIKTASLLAFDTYHSLRSNGGFILIDETSNATAGAGIFQ